MVNKRYFSIGEVSKLKDVTIKALRYYHDIGLLTPAYINPENGYRYYTINQFFYLDIILNFAKQGNKGIENISKKSVPWLNPFGFLFLLFLFHFDILPSFVISIL